MILKIKIWDYWSKFWCHFEIYLVIKITCRLCNIVYEYERECNKEENKEKESSPFQNGRTKENLSPFRVEYILNQNDDNNNV